MNPHFDVTVVENRAPTAASVKLLREMEQSARDTVIQSFRTSADMSVTGSVTIMWSRLTMGMEAIVQFRLNGTDYERRLTLPDARQALDAFDAARLLHREVADAIAAMLVVPALNEVSLLTRRPL